MTSGLRWTPEQLRAFTDRSKRATAALRKPAERAGLKAEVTLLDQFVAAGLPAPYRDFTFHRLRDWRIDLAWPAVKVGIEVDGGVHRTKERFYRDMDKHNALMQEGWRYLRVTPDEVRSGEAAERLTEVLRGWLNAGRP